MLSTIIVDLLQNTKDTFSAIHMRVYHILKYILQFIIGHPSLHNCSYQARFTD